MIQKAKIILTAILLAFHTLCAHAEINLNKEDSDIAKIMKDNKAEGTILLASENNKEKYIF